MTTRLQSVLDYLKGSVQKDEFKIPFTIPTISVGIVLRENNLISLPYSLMVKGDVIRMTFGDISPEKIQLISDERIILKKGEIFTPKVKFYYLTLVTKYF